MPLVPEESPEEPAPEPEPDIPEEPDPDPEPDMPDEPEPELEPEPERPEEVEPEPEPPLMDEPLLPPDEPEDPPPLPPPLCPRAAAPYTVRPAAAAAAIINRETSNLIVYSLLSRRASAEHAFAGSRWSPPRRTAVRSCACREGCTGQQGVAGRGKAESRRDSRGDLSGLQVQYRPAEEDGISSERRPTGESLDIMRT